MILQPSPQYANSSHPPPETRFTPIYDFGYVAMNFGWVYPEDSGEYICRATNLYGTDETRAIIKCSGKTGIVYESQLPKGMMSIDRIREMESGWQRAPDLLETVLDSALCLPNGVVLAPCWHSSQ